MSFRGRAAGLAVLALSCAGCRSAPAALGDAELAACIPPATLALAGVHLDAVRASPLLRQLGAGVDTLLQPFRDASNLLVAYDGKDWLLIARGSFQTAPPGAVLLSPRLALAGPPNAVRAAAAQHARGTSGTPTLTIRAQSAAVQPVWAVVQGGVSLPLTDNLANLNRLMAETQYVTLTAELNSGLVLHAAGVCRSADEAQHLEETVRGLLSLAAPASRSRDLGALLGSIHPQRDGNTVHADLNASPDAVQQLLGTLAR